MDDVVKIKIDSEEVEKALLETAKRASNLKPLMKNIAGVMADTVEENFADEGRPDKWQELAESTIKRRTKKGNWPGKILQVQGQLASSVSTQYDNESAVIGSNLDYAAIHQLGGQAGKGKKTTIPARPYLNLDTDDFEEILHEVKKHIN
ncbi:MAG: phage virion morphogenesis protein [Candidatus Gastranaerophilales bacterium]